MAFRGHYEHSLDAKNRVTVPAKFRPALSDGLVLARAFEPCIAVWTPDGWERFTQNFLESLNPFSERARRLQRFFHAGSFDSELDSAGRIMLPQPLMEYAQIKKEVTVTGNLGSFEIWDTERWNGYESDLAKTALADAEEIAAGN